MSPQENNILPPDATPEEVEFFNYSIVNLYSSLKNQEDMFLVAFCYELGYEKQMAAQILGLSPASITSRLKKIRSHLQGGYAKNRGV